MKSLAVASLAVAFLACFVLVGADAQEKAEPKAKDSVEAARAVVIELEEAFRTDNRRPSDEQFYTWSDRLAEAELSAAGDATAKRAALAAHAERMKVLERRTTASYSAGVVPRAEVLAAMYFRITADERLQRGR